MDTQVVHILKQIKADHGDAIFLNRSRFNALLKDYTKGQYKGEIRLLTTALDEGLYRDFRIIRQIIRKSEDATYLS